MCYHINVVELSVFIFSFKASKILDLWEKMDIDKKREVDVLIDKQKLFILTITDLLWRGLGHRVLQIAVKNYPFNKWQINSNPSKTASESLIIGLKLNPETALSVIEKGPEANLPEVMCF